MPLPTTVNPLLRDRPSGKITATTHRRESKARRTKRLTREQNAIAQIGELPSDGEDLVLIMTDDWHGWDLVAAIHELARCNIDALHVATLGFNKRQTEHLADLIDAGVIRQVTMLVSEMFREKNKAEFATLRDALESRGQRIAATRNHAKLMVFRLADGRRLCTHGSLNLRRCNSFEQVVITHDAGLCQFFQQFIEEQIT